ncbi:hypothetical protein REG_1695 [Candidatus Regiella insecticola LSR1]|uniref:Uncharacterized protein n=1 Tax=Candidatus Regiella insecticola LSR1 TaxID=663321 RepID=E0WUB8_9ENTR|nr:hypothetical protein REG_1695 [Candidatus Regiella insecticola LSR1]
MQLFNFKHHKSLYRLLVKIISMRFIQKSIFTSRLNQATLRDITYDDPSWIRKPEYTVFPRRFEPSELTGWTLNFNAGFLSISCRTKESECYLWISSS